MWLYKLIEIVVEYRRFIILNTASVTVLAIVISLLLPKTYEAKTTVLPPESESPMSALAGLSAGHLAMAVTNFSLPLMATPSDLYASMLQSQTILGETVDSLGLMSVYDSEKRQSAIETLKKKVHVRVEPEGIVTVQAEAHSPQLAADIANTMIEMLDRLNRRLQNQKGTEYREFLSKRLDETDSLLATAQDELRDFQEKNRAISLDKQSEVLIENLAKQKAALTAAEVELEVMSKTMSADHPEYRQKKMVVNELRRKLNEIERGSGPDTLLSVLNLDLTKIPDLVLKFAILKRNARIYELSYEMLYQQYESAKLQEKRDMPTLMRLDTAKPPITASKPSKKLIVIAAFLLSGGFSVAFAIFLCVGREEGSTIFEFKHRAEKWWREIKHSPLG